jgi:transcriptional regulator with XRE-family HTH domain
MIYDRIKKIRELSGLTQTELAKKLGITRSSVNSWEMGTNIPTVQYVIELSKIFGITSDSILDLEANITLSLDSLNDEEKKIIFSLIQYFNQNKL